MEWIEKLSKLRLVDIQSSLETEQAGAVNVKFENNTYNLNFPDRESVEAFTKAVITPEIERVVKETVIKQLKPLSNTLSALPSSISGEVVVASTMATAIDHLKTKSKETGVLIVGGGVPKNFVQDTVVAADILGIDSPMHKYAVQLTVADERDGALSGSTFKEASSWGKVNQDNEQLVFGEATITFPLLASFAYHNGSWKHRKPKELNLLFS